MFMTAPDYVPLENRHTGEVLEMRRHRSVARMSGALSGRAGRRLPTHGGQPDGARPDSRQQRVAVAAVSCDHSHLFCADCREVPP